MFLCSFLLFRGCKRHGGFLLSQQRFASLLKLMSNKSKTSQPASALPNTWTVTNSNATQNVDHGFECAVVMRNHYGRCHCQQGRLSRLNECAEQTRRQCRASPGCFVGAQHIHTMRSTFAISAAEPQQHARPALGSIHPQMPGKGTARRWYGRPCLRTF